MPVDGTAARHAAISACAVCGRAPDDASHRHTLAAEDGRYGYRRITVLLQRAGWCVGKDRVQSIRRREGLKAPAKHRPRRRLWLNDGSCIGLRPEHRNHVWSYDLVEACTHDGRSLRLLTLVDEFTRECLAIWMARKLNSHQVIETLGLPTNSGWRHVGLPFRLWKRSGKTSPASAKSRFQWLDGKAQMSVLRSVQS